jgi:hypothetical protein
MSVMNSTTLDSTSRVDWPRVLVAGAGAGVVATLAMSAVMLGLQRAGLLGRTPPRHIVEHTLARLGIRGKVSPATSKALSVAAHLGFGASQGVLYALGHGAHAARKGNSGQGPSAVSGVPFALGVWGASYAGWIPALDILPPPSRDRLGRPTSMALAHVVYGAVLARAFRRFL